VGVNLVLSLFPGIGLLDMAFEEEGFCVVRGPDLLWGGDIKRFHPPAGKFDGVIGGPPCKWWSSASNIAKARGQTVQPDMIPEFSRCIDEARPSWFVMENVPRAPLPQAPGYFVQPHVVNANHFGADQWRVRRFTWGSRFGLRLDLVCDALHSEPRHNAVTTRNLKWDALRQRPRSTNSLATWSDALAAQGLPADFLADCPLTTKGKWECVGNGVPLAMGRAVAKAVKRAIAPHSAESAP
jgi:DNA (cytosine-5)-methyltransferase 1